MSGHRVITGGKLNFYAATKFAVTALAEGWRNEVRSIEPPTNIRVAQVSPGIVKTEFQLVSNTTSAFANISDPLQSEDLADMIRYVIQAPAHMQILDIKVKPTMQIF